MLEAAKIVQQMLVKRNFQAFFIGGKTRTLLNNKLFPDDKLFNNDIDIATNASPDQIKEIFPNHKHVGNHFPVVIVKFAGHEFEVATFRVDKYNNNNELKDIELLIEPINESNTNEDYNTDTNIQTNTLTNTLTNYELLNLDRNRRDFTMNTIAEDHLNNLIDFQYIYKNKTISAMEDIQNKLIRAVGNPKLRFEEDPLRILRLFRFMSQTGYEIEKTTYKYAIKHLKLLEQLPQERIAIEFNKLLQGKNVSKTLKLLQDINFFDLNIQNNYINKPNKLLPDFKYLKHTYFDALETYNHNNISVNNSNTTVTNTINILEVWTILLKPLGKQKALDNLKTLYPISIDDMDRIEWIIDNFSIINSDNIRMDIWNNRTGIVKRKELQCLRSLIKNIANIHVSIFNDEDIELKASNLYDRFCDRPYFYSQLHVTGDQIIEIADEKPGKWVEEVKDKLLLKLINMDNVPKLDDDYLQLVKQSIEEVLIGKIIDTSGLLDKMGDRLYPILTPRGQY